MTTGQGPTSQPHRCRRALIVEDDPAIRKLVDKLLVRSGIEVDSARDGKQAIEKIRKGNYSVLVLDLMVPEINGYEIIEYIKNLHDYPTKYMGLRGLLGAIYPYFLTYSILERYAEIRRTLRPPHGPGLIGDIDTLIAATALERNLRVVTTDGDYERVPGLKVRRISLKRV